MKKLYRELVADMYVYRIKKWLSKNKLMDDFLDITDEERNKRLLEARKHIRISKKSILKFKNKIRKYKRLNGGGR